MELMEWFETFGCDVQHAGIPAFVYIYNACISNKTRGVKGKVAHRCLEEYAALKGIYYLAINSQMRAALRPILEAEDSALDYFGLHLHKRTPCALADALADIAVAGRAR